jgi:hypothetical protein
MPSANRFWTLLAAYIALSLCTYAVYAALLVRT